MIKLVHMGDSITVGQYVNPQKRWSALVGERLAAEGLRIEAFNVGISGETTRMGLARFPAAAQAHSAHVMTLQYGLNDCNCWETDQGLPRVSPAAFHANLVEMIARARRFGAQRIVLQTNHPTLRDNTMASGERYEDANARYSEITVAVAAETSVALCDIRPAFAQFTQDEMAGMLLPAPDVLHLSEAGNLVYADAIYPFVLEAVRAAAEQLPEECQA
jgi:lysophospholipase L1-like esterase